MGEVYRADDLTLGRPVALKFLPSYLEHDPAARERLLAEVRNARTVSHPNICRPFPSTRGGRGRAHSTAPRSCSRAPHSGDEWSSLNGPASSGTLPVADRAASCPLRSGHRSRQSPRRSCSR